MKYIIIDTNFLLIPAQFKVDIFAEIERIADFPYKIAVIDKTLDELKKIKNTQKGKNRLAASLALKLLKTKDLKIIASPQKQTRLKQGVKEPFVDDIIVELTKKSPEKWVVATQDIGLKRRLRKNNIKLIILRQKRYLKLV